MNGKCLWVRELISENAYPSEASSNASPRLSIRC